MTDEQIREAFVALCERNGAAEKVRDYHARAGGWAKYWAEKEAAEDLLEMLGLTALLTPPETCARCGGHGRILNGDAGDIACGQARDCPACGGADDD